MRVTNFKVVKLFSISFICFFLNLQVFAQIGQNQGTNDLPNRGIRFYLYANPEDEDNRQEILFDDQLSLVNSGYNQSLPLIMMLHGVLSNSLTLTDVQVVKNAYLKENFPANLVLVDYGALTQSNLPFFLSTLSIVKLLISHANTDTIASHVAEFLIFLKQSNVLAGPENVHLIGLGLGAHIAGTVGRHIQERTGQKVRRITGLDPSLQIPIRTVKLDKEDAEFVDVTLTSLGAIASVIREGHVQFFINGGGPHQPNCPKFAPFTETFCSHTTAVFYFAKSIRKHKRIPACKCSFSFTCTRLPLDCTDRIWYGQYTSDAAQGMYYVKLH